MKIYSLNTDLHPGEQGGDFEVTQHSQNVTEKRRSWNIVGELSRHQT